MNSTALQRHPALTPNVTPAARRARRDPRSPALRFGRMIACIDAAAPVGARVFGAAVKLARRIRDEAEPGQILVSDVVHQLAAGKGFAVVDNGEATLKGFEKPVRLHEVRWRDG